MHSVWKKSSEKIILLQTDGSNMFISVGGNMNISVDNNLYISLENNIHILVDETPGIVGGAPF